MHQRGPLPIGVACEVIRQTALGLQHAHEKRLVHRDIKPSNLMVSVVRGPSSVVKDKTQAPRITDMRVKILDFGLAQLHRRRNARPADDTEAGRHPITGTPDFMSPEQARNRDLVDIRSDLYSLGCTFYYLLTGTVPFPGGGMLDKLIRHQSEVPPAPEKLRPRVPPAVAAIVLKLMAKDPADRYQTPQELADALTPHASLRALDDSRMSPRHVEAAQLSAEKTLGPGRDDTAPHACLLAALSAEHEAISSWIEIRLDERRQHRRRLLWSAGAVVTLAAAATAVFLWLQLM